MTRRAFPVIANLGTDRTQRTRTLALGSQGSRFYSSVQHELHHFGDVMFRHERDFSDADALLAFVRGHLFDWVLMPNPYGNPQRLACYRALRAANVGIVVSDRGALPESWFFDRGFNYDSPSYSPAEWDRPLSTVELAMVRGYLYNLRRSSEALEVQGPRARSLRDGLCLGDARILFVPLQRPNDAVVRHFAGAGGSVEGLVRLVEQVSETLGQREPGTWKVVLKKHPLETTRIPTRGPGMKYAPDDAHVHDLLALADAVVVLNSGVGLLSLCFGRPTIHFGQAFYGQPGLAVHADTPEQAADLVQCRASPDEAKVERFVHHLTTRVYSFASSETKLRAHASGARQRVTTHLEFRSLRLLGRDVPVGGDRVLVVSPVIPSSISRGSDARVDAMIRALTDQGKRVSLAVLNGNVADPQAADLAREIRLTHPKLEVVEVLRHPKLDRSMRGRLTNAALRTVDALSAGTQRIHNFTTCPPEFRRLVGEMCGRLKPHILLVNYAKLTPVVPRGLSAITVLDTHDYQTGFLEEDQRVNRRRMHILRPLYRWSEHRAIRKFDRILAISASEKEVFERIAPKRTVHFVPAFAEAKYVTSDFEQVFSHDALLVASVSTFNVTGLLWFIDCVLPRIRAQRPLFELVVVGTVQRARAMRNVRPDGLRFLGVVPDLKPLYGQTRCVIAPLLGGAGMKIKVVEALAHGKAVVATPAALEGIRVTDGSDVVVAESPEDFASAVLRVLDDDSLRARLEAGARTLHERDHSTRAVSGALNAAFSRRPI